MPGKTRSPKKEAKGGGPTFLLRNKRARHEFLILERFEAGISLVGTEVKSLRERKGSLEESYIRFEGKEAFWIKGHIPEYGHGGKVLNHDPHRKRKLLLRRSQLRKLSEKVGQKGLTLVPLSLFLGPRSWIKMEIGLCRGKKAHDKRESEKRKTAKREMDRYS